MAVYGGRATKISPASTQWRLEQEYVNFVPLGTSTNSNIAFTLSLHKEPDGTELGFDAIASDCGELGSVWGNSVTNKLTRPVRASCED